MASAAVVLPRLFDMLFAHVAETAATRTRMGGFFAFFGFHDRRMACGVPDLAT
jgi:hypothetical protein